MKRKLLALLMQRRQRINSTGSLGWKALPVSLTLSLCIGIALSGLALAKELSKKEQQAEIRSMAKETLAQLYKLQPEARKAVQSSAGYATFSNFGLKIFVLGSGKGEGIAVNNKTKKETFMKMLELQTGLGFGAKNFRHHIGAPGLHCGASSLLNEKSPIVRFFSLTECLDWA